MVCSIIPHNRLASDLASVSGNVPVELGQLVNLTVLELQNNKLTGALWYVPSYRATNWLLTLASIFAVHSDGGREDGTEGEAPALLHLLLEVCRTRTLHIQRNYGIWYV